MIRSVQKRLGAEPEVFSGIFEDSLVYAEKPHQDDLVEIGKKFSVNADTLRDALDPYEAPRFESENATTYMFVRYPEKEKSERSTVPFLIVLTKGGIVTIAQEQTPFMEKFVLGQVDFDTSQRADLFLKLLSEVNALYGHGITEVQRAVNRKKQRIDAITENDIVELTAHEMTLNDYMDALVPQSGALAKLLTGRVFEIDKRGKDLIEDLILSVHQHAELTRSLLKTTADIRSAYTAISTQRLNVVIRRLTALTVLVTIPNVITGFYGMNLVLPYAHSPGAALFVLGGMIAIVAGIALMLLKNRWL